MCVSFLYIYLEFCVYKEKKKDIVQEYLKMLMESLLYIFNRNRSLLLISIMQSYILFIRNIISINCGSVIQIYSYTTCTFKHFRYDTERIKQPSSVHCTLYTVHCSVWFFIETFNDPYKLKESKRVSELKIDIGDR